MPTIDLANLNFIAGHKAKSATAYEPALKYLIAGMKNLSEDGWLTQYEKHGGNLTCISAPGQGAEFMIEIPIQQRMK